MPATPTTEVALVDLVSTDVEQYALAAYLAGYCRLTRDASALGQSSPGAVTTTSACSALAAQTSNASPATLKRMVDLGPRSPAGCRRWRASIATRSRKGCSRRTVRAPTPRRWDVRARLGELLTMAQLAAAAARR